LSANARANIEQLTDAHTKHWPRYPMTTSAPHSPNLPIRARRN
jgi:hypothetical protein